MLLINMHHIVSDGWSESILKQELSTLYGAFVRGERDPLPELEVQYADYAVWQREWMEGEVLRQQAEYWQRRLSGAPALLELPTDHARPAEQDYTGGWVRVELEEELTRALKELSKQHGMTLYMTMLAGWAALLARLSGQAEVVIGTPVANRGQIETEGLIGFFVNMLALRIDVSGSGSVVELLQQVKEQVLAGQQHQDIPFERIVENLSPTRSLNRTPVFQVMFTFVNGSPVTAGLNGLAVEKEAIGTDEFPARFDFEMQALEDDGKLHIIWLYNSDLFDARSIEQMSRHYVRLLNAVVTNADLAIGQITMLDPHERHQLLYEWNATEAEYPRERCVQELIEAQVEKTPEAVAVVFEDAVLSYGELNRRANQLGHYLRELGVGPDTRVALCVERGLEMMVGLLGILKEGGAYVPLDPAYPQERLQYMLADSAPVVLLTEAHPQGLFVAITPALPVLELDAAAPPWSNQPETNPLPENVGLTSQHLAYVIYTSGSTGTPKGVMISHRALTNFLRDMQRRPGITADDVFLATTTLSFDIAALELYLPLLVGAQLRLLKRETVLDGEALVQQLTRGATLMQATPTSWQMLVESGWQASAGLKALCGGEALGTELARQIVGRSGTAWNMYGPTETTVWSLVEELAPGATGVSIGRPIANTQVYILDQQREAVPVGVAGELYIGGEGVGRGYWQRAELTAERFVSDPFAKEHGARMYRTGDQARWLVDGRVEFLGRIDQQVKVRGYRIELGEIEARLVEHEAVREAVVMAREETAGDKRLVAYYTSVVSNSNGNEGAGAEALRQHLSALLPEYMVPAAYVHLEQLPLTPNGKLDRKALPAPDGEAYAVRAFEDLVGEKEKLIASVWTELLKLERVGRYDNFFDLGGHSLLAMRMISQIRKALAVEVTVRDLFTQPVLADFVRLIESAAQVTLPPITRCERDGLLPLSLAQQRLWLLAQMGASQAYHIFYGWRMKGQLNRAALRRSLDRIVARHEALRTTFVAVEGEPQQRITAAIDSCFRLLEHDLSDAPNSGEELDQLVREEAAGRFDLAAGPLIRGRLVRVSADEHALLITMHHIVSDGWSMDVFVKELSALYGAFVRGEGDPLPELEVQYADYAVWQRRWMEGEVLRQQSEYWQQQLAGAPALLELPIDHARPTEQEYVGGRVKILFDEELTRGLKELSKQHGVTLYMTLLGAWATLLGRLSGQADVVIGTPVANRSRAEAEGLIGFFINTLPLRLEVAGSVGELLQQVKEQVLAAQQHQGIPFEQIVDVVQPVRNLAYTPLFQVLFAWHQHIGGGGLMLPGLELAPLSTMAPVITKFDLRLSLRDGGERIVGGMEYATALFDEATVERYLGYLRLLLQSMVRDSKQAVESLPLLSTAEQRQVVSEWNATEAAYPRDRCVQELFEAQVEKRFAAAAVVCEDQVLSYGELNRRANQLAHYLRELGVGPEQRVALCAERGLAMIIGLLVLVKPGSGDGPPARA